jgi:hypothetical protein
LRSTRVIVDLSQKLVVWTEALCVGHMRLRFDVNRCGAIVETVEDTCRCAVNFWDDGGRWLKPELSQ